MPQRPILPEKEAPTTQKKVGPAKTVKTGLRKATCRVPDYHFRSHCPTPLLYSVGAFDFKTQQYFATDSPTVKNDIQAKIISAVTRFVEPLTLGTGGINAIALSSGLALLPSGQ